MTGVRQKGNVLGVLVDVVDYASAVERIVGAAHARRPYATTALAVHGVMTGRNVSHRSRLNSFDLVTPDGQPVRWALNLLHGADLRDTVCGTTLTVSVLERAASEGLPVYFYGSTSTVLCKLLDNVAASIPGLQIAGAQPSRFEAVTGAALDAIASDIAASGAMLVFVGLGCPRQEVFVYELRKRLSIPTLAVGAAFDYLAGTLQSPPAWIRASGLEWAWRLLLEPRRLWRRYAILNPLYLLLLVLQGSRLWRPTTDGGPPPTPARVDA